MTDLEIGQIALSNLRRSIEENGKRLDVTIDDYINGVGELSIDCLGTSATGDSSLCLYIMAYEHVLARFVKQEYTDPVAREQFYLEVVTRSANVCNEVLQILATARLDKWEAEGKKLIV